MLVPVIKFDVARKINYKGVNVHTIEECVVRLDTENYDAMYALPMARNIEFTKMIDFEFANKEHAPVEFSYLFATEEDELCPIDEMVGMVF